MGPGTLESVRTKSAEEVMSLRPNSGRLLLLAVLVTLGGFSDWEPLLWAAPANLKHGAKPPVVPPSALDRQIPTPPPRVSVKPPTRTESSKTLAAGTQRQAPSERPPRKTPRHRKAGKKWRPPAVVQPKPDLSYHGIFEQPQRYDPSRDRRTGRAPNPQAGGLQHDHFQELDKNHDGMIDPFERAFGRLDMDRDVGNRQWE